MLHSVFERADKLDGEKEGEDGDDDCDDEDMLYVLSHFNRVSLFCDSMDCSPPGFPVHGILQARVLEQIAMPSSRESSQPRDWLLISYIPALASGMFISNAACW